MKIAGPMLMAMLLAGAAHAQRPELVPQTGHGDMIDEVAFSPDGRLLATAGSYTVKLWSPESGLLLRTLDVKTLTPSLAFSPDGRTLVVGEGMGADVESSPAAQLRGSGDGYQIQFWDVRSGKLLRKAKGHSFWVSDIAFSPDGKWLATAGAEGEVLLRDPAAGEVRARIRGKVVAEKAVWPRLAFSRDSSMLAIYDAQSDIEIVHVKNPTAVRDLGAATRRGIVLSFTADGASLLAALPAADAKQGRNLVRWNLAAGTMTMLVPKLQGPVAISHDGTLAAAAEETADGKALAFYDVRDDKRLGESLPGYNIVEFSPGDDLLVTSNPYVTTRSVTGMPGAGGGSPEVIVWRLADAYPLRIPHFSLEDPGTEVVAYSVATGDGGHLLARRIAGMTGGETLTLWDLTSNSGPQMVRVPQGATGNIALSRKGKQIALNVAGGVFVGNLDGSKGALLPLPGGDTSSSADVVAFSPDEQFVARTQLMGKVKDLVIWNRTSGKVALHTTDVVGFAWMPDSTEFVAGDQEGDVAIRSAATGNAVRPLAAKVKVNAVAVSPDGSRIAAGGDDGVVHLWDASGRDLGILQGRGCRPWSAGALPNTITIRTMGDCITMLAFSPDGRLLAASGPSDGAPISVWDVRSEKLLYSFSSELDPTSSIDSKIPFAFTADSRYLIKGTRYLTFWDLKTGQEAAMLASTAAGDWLVIAPDGYFDGSPNAWKAVAWRFGGDTFDVVPAEAFYNDFYEPGLLAMIAAGHPPAPKMSLEKRDRRQPVVSIDTKQAGNDTRHLAVSLNVCQAPADASHAQGSGARDLRLFRNGALVKRWNGDLLAGRDCAAESATVTLPGGDNDLTAYAFNNDGIKSNDATASADTPAATGVRGTAYIIAVGVNRYAAPGIDLRYARDDAQAIASRFGEDQAALHNFAKVATVLLLDDQATAEHIRTALSILGGATPTLSAADRTLFAGLQATQPEDGVFLFFAGHGAAEGSHFYLLPHDVNLRLLASDPAKAHAISDIDLDDLFAQIDGSHFLVVIDACRSGEALEAVEKRQGAMDSPGLAQLAYDKGMYILTASQAYQPALEASQFGHGLLTWALLNAMSPKEKPRVDLYLLDWIQEASEEVPTLQRDFMNGTRGVSIVEDQQTLPLDERDVQQPRLFYRRNPDPNPLVIVPGQQQAPPN